MTEQPDETPYVPSWLRFPPNCCETCERWEQTTEHSGRCESDNSTHAGDETDSRFRCQDFKRKQQ